MRHHIDPYEHALELADAFAMLNLANDSLLSHPLSTSDIAWAKGCLERAAQSLGVVLLVTTTERRAA